MQNWLIWTRESPAWLNDVDFVLHCVCKGVHTQVHTDDLHLKMEESKIKKVSPKSTRDQ